jgi:hypothetical protein
VFTFQLEVKPLNVTDVSIARPGTCHNGSSNVIDATVNLRKVGTMSRKGHSAAWLRVFSLMIEKPEQEWTAEAILSRLTDAPAVPRDAVLEMFYLLMHDRLAEPVPFQRALTVRLTEVGLTALRQAVTGQ